MILCLKIRVINLILHTCDFAGRSVLLNTNPTLNNGVAHLTRLSSFKNFLCLFKALGFIAYHRFKNVKRAKNVQHNIHIEYL